MAANRRGGRLAALGAPTRAPTTGNRRSIRLRGYDYATPGAYFVTICTHDRRPALRHPKAARAVEETWAWLPQRFPHVELDEFVVMPDHLHFVIWILDEPANHDRRGGHPAAQGAPMRAPTGYPPSTAQGGLMRAPTLGSVVGTFKTVTAKSINLLRGTRGARVWQRNYFEHVIRNDDELAHVQDYIRNNPFVEHTHSAGDVVAAWEVKIAPAVPEVY